MTIRSMADLKEAIIRFWRRCVGQGARSDFPLLGAFGRLARTGATVPRTRRPRSVRRILIVDDNLDAMEGLALLLELSGRYETKTAKDGCTALDMARTFHPDAIFLDLRLPGMDGIEVAHRLRDEHGRALLLVAMTGNGREEDHERAKAAGFDHHLVKPTSIEAVQDVLQFSSSVFAITPKVSV